MTEAELWGQTVVCVLWTKCVNWILHHMPWGCALLLCDICMQKWPLRYSVYRQRHFHWEHWMNGKRGEIDLLNLVNVSTGEKFVLSWTFLLLKQEFLLNGVVLRRQVYLMIWKNFGALYPDVWWENFLTEDIFKWVSL